jgi:serine/threonine protein phosphatase PrpC
MLVRMREETPAMNTLMRDSGELEIAPGFASATGPRDNNQDFGGVYLGSALERARHGVLAALADGVSGGREGRAAAELAVRALVEGFYAAPATWGPGRAMQRALDAYNRWLHAQGRGATMANSATTLTLKLSTKYVGSEVESPTKPPKVTK